MTDTSSKDSTPFVRDLLWPYRHHFPIGIFEEVVKEVGIELEKRLAATLEEARRAHLDAGTSDFHEGAVAAFDELRRTGP